MALSIHVRPLLSHMHTLSPYVPNQSTCMYSQSTCTYCQSMCTYCQSTCVLSQSTCVHSIYCVLSMHMCSLAYRCFFPFPTDSDVRIDPFISLNTVCVQHIMVKMCGRESFALTHASWGFGDGDPSLLLIAFCLPLIAWLLLPSSLSPTNVHSFLMGSGFSLCAISIHPCLTFISSSATKSPTAGRSLHRKNSPAQAVPCLHVSPARLAGSWTARPDEHT